MQRQAVAFLSFVRLHVWELVRKGTKDCHLLRAGPQLVFLRMFLIEDIETLRLLFDVFKPAEICLIYLHDVSFGEEARITWLFVCCASCQKRCIRQEGKLLRRSLVLLIRQ